MDVDYAVTFAMRRFEVYLGVCELFGGLVILGELCVIVILGGGFVLFKCMIFRVFGVVTFFVSVDSKWAYVAFEL